MVRRFFHNKTAVVTVTFLLLVALMGVLAPVLAPHDPYETDILVLAWSTHWGLTIWDAVCCPG